MNTDRTLKEIGQQFSVTRERIRQIEANAKPAEAPIEIAEAAELPGQLTPGTHPCEDGNVCVIPGCALLGADPESSTVHCSGFRVRAKRRAPE
jgi:hypothetical protein